MWMDPHGVAFTGEGKLVRKATGYEQEKLKPRYLLLAKGAHRINGCRPIGRNTARYEGDDNEDEQ